MIDWFLSPLLIGLAYLCGSLSSAILLCRWAKAGDPRQQGSGNPGATNVLRFGGKKLAAAVLAGDWFKGLLPVVIAHILNLPPAAIGLCALAAFLGHVFPLFFNFKGGKGVATGSGAIMGLAWQAGIMLMLCWLLVAWISRYSSLAAILATLLAPIVTFVWGRTEYVLPVFIMSVLLLWRHRENIKRLLNGQEGKIGEK